MASLLRAPKSAPVRHTVFVPFKPPVFRRAPAAEWMVPIAKCDVNGLLKQGACHGATVGPEDFAWVRRAHVYYAAGAAECPVCGTNIAPGHRRQPCWISPACACRRAQFERSLRGWTVITHTEAAILRVGGYELEVDAGAASRTSYATAVSKDKTLLGWHVESVPYVAAPVANALMLVRSLYCVRGSEASLAAMVMMMNDPEALRALDALVRLSGKDTEVTSKFVLDWKREHFGNGRLPRPSRLAAKPTPALGGSRMSVPLVLEPLFYALGGKPPPPAGPVPVDT